MDSNAHRRLVGKVAIVTGGASGIGRASALAFLREGARVVVADLNEPGAAETLKIAGSEGYGEKIRFRRCDVAEEDDVAGVVAFAVSEFGGLDCMFNNAGVGGAFGPITETRVEDWDRTFAVMVRGVFSGTKHAGRAMIGQGRGGTVINTASVAAHSAGAGPPAYASCKAAIVNFTRCAAVELARARIRVNAICPGAILTPMVHRGREEGMEAAFSTAQPWPETGRPEHVASVAVFLASEDSRFVTGEAIVVDGGLTALGPGLYAGANPGGNAVVERVVSALGLADVLARGEAPAGFDSGTTGGPGK